MRSIATAIVACLIIGSGVARAAEATATTTVSGIPLDAPWKVKIYAFAREHFHHPAWGWEHSERDYRLAMEFAKGDGINVDPDIVFAAAMMHDMAAFAPWETPDVKTGKVEHGDVAAKDCVPILRDAGFPMEKIKGVQEAESDHMFYSKATLPEAIVLHDADSVDFLGTMGAARIISTVGEDKPSMKGAIKTLHTFLQQIPPGLITKSAKKAAEPRIAELKTFLDQLDAEDAGGKLI